MTKHFYDVHLRHHLILRHVMVRHIIVLLCHVGDIYVFVSSCKCYSRLVNVCHGFVPSWFWYFCHSNAFHAHACHAIVCHAIVTSCKCLSCNRGHVNERPTSASSCVPRWLPLLLLRWRTEEREGCVPWNAEGVVCNKYLQHLHCAILHFAFCILDSLLCFTISKILTLGPPMGWVHADSL